ncbi:LIM domain-containing protein [Actinidia rufa]|uniref:LIM domain-containing protein n=1 Tax=Actinidia rufa TaxID=165716 RepID=A0A7J0F6D9_9ERIC|nr:LIM domain-containing protein [Actinidia rufa]
MGWITKILKGSSHKISEGQYHGKYADERIWDSPSTVDAWPDYDNEDIDRAIAISLSEDDQKGKQVIDESYVDEDEQLAKALQESMNIGSPQQPPRYDNGNLFPPYPYFYPAGYRSQQMQVVSLSTEHILFGHKNTAPRTNVMGLLDVVAVKKWSQRTRDIYCLMMVGSFVGMECLDSAIMDTHECQPLYLEIQEFYEGLHMKVEQQVPLLLVERQALNEAMEGEKNGHHHLPETRGLCLSEEQTVSTDLCYRKPPDKLRLLTGSILAHEMMHAWLRLKGYRNLSPEVEEGICQVLAHMWLDSEIVAGSGSTVASTSSSSPSSSSSSGSTSSKKGKRSQFEKKLGEFFKHQIESDTSAAYGEGFRAGNQAMLKYDLRRTLDHIRLTGSFPL